MTHSHLRSRIAELRPLALPVFDVYSSDAVEVILIGSAATGRLGPNSDIDVIFVGTGRRYKKSGVDFIWVPLNRISSKMWLGSEMATHVAAYGKWVKGDGLWRRKVYFSATAIRSKSERILIRLMKIYNLRRVVKRRRSDTLLLRSLMDMQRLVFLRNEIPSPPAPILLSSLVNSRHSVLEACCDEQLLGELGRTLLFDIFDFGPAFSAAETDLWERAEDEILL